MDEPQLVQLAKELRAVCQKYKHPDGEIIFLLMLAVQGTNEGGGASNLENYDQVEKFAEQWLESNRTVMKSVAERSLN